MCVCICVCAVKQKMICTDSVWPLRVCAMHGRPQWKQLLQHNHKPHSQAPLPTHFADDILIISQNPYTHSPLCHVSGRSHERACHFAKCVKVWDGFQRPMLMDIWALKCVHVLHKPQTCMCRCKWVMRLRNVPGELLTPRLRVERFWSVPDSINRAAEEGGAFLCRRVENWVHVTN